MRLIKKIAKIFGIVLSILFIGLFIAVHIFLRPSSDKDILEEFSDTNLHPKVYNKPYKAYTYRVLAMQQAIDTTLPTLVFVHGSPGSSMDFKRYFKDSLINAQANILAYDRIGYGPGNSGEVLGSLDSELEVLHDVIKDLPSENVILVGYSYGGTVVLASPKKYRYKVSLASAISADLEPMFWALKLYKWSLTRALMPKSLKAAAKEKYSHLSDLPNYDKKWNKSPSKVLNIQGDKDWIVPFENSKLLQQKLDSSKLHMLIIKNGGHELIWSDFKLIRDELIKTIKKG